MVNAHPYPRLLLCSSRAPSSALGWLLKRGILLPKRLDFPHKFRRNKLHRSGSPYCRRWNVDIFGCIMHEQGVINSRSFIQSPSVAPEAVSALLRLRHRWLFAQRFQLQCIDVRSNFFQLCGKAESREMIGLRAYPVTCVLRNKASL